MNVREVTQGEVISVGSGALIKIDGLDSREYNNDRLKGMVFVDSSVTDFLGNALITFQFSRRPFEGAKKIVFKRHAAYPGQPFQKQAFVSYVKSKRLWMCSEVSCKLLQVLTTAKQFTMYYKV